MTPKGSAFIRSYGLFWRREEVNWSPGHGNGKDFRLLGRRGKRYPKLEVADFRDQLGIYVLHDDYGAYYVGLARYRAIAKRLKDHTRDTHQDNWDRFSWFGFRGGPDNQRHQRADASPARCRKHSSPTRDRRSETSRRS